MENQKDKKINWIFMRGLARGTGHWANFNESLKKYRPDIKAEFIDFPGNGGLSHRESPIDPRKAVEALRAQSAFIKNKEKFHFCGLSLGGMLGLQWAEYYPEDFHSLVLINSSLRQFSAFYERLQPSGLYWLGKAAISKDLKDREYSIFKMVSNKEEKAQMYLNDFSLYAKSHSTSPANVVRQFILANKIFIKPGLSIPTKVLASQEDHMVLPLCSTAIAKFLNCELVIHPTAGHDLPFDEPEWVIKNL